MDQTEVIELIREAIFITIKVGGPVMMVGLVVGVLIALVQALTQIQEITLVFVPKILAIFAALFVFLPFMTVTLIAFMHELADRMIGMK